MERRVTLNPTKSRLILPASLEIAVSLQVNLQQDHFCSRKIYIYCNINAHPLANAYCQVGSNIALWC